MKSYQYPFSKIVHTLIYVGLALSVVGLGLTSYQLFRFGLSHSASAFYGVLQYVLMYAVSIALLVIFTTALIRSYYGIDAKHLVTSFGIIKSKYEIAKMKSLIFNRTASKIKVTFADETFIILSVNNDWIDDFVDQLQKVNPSLSYAITTDEQEKNK